MLGRPASLRAIGSDPDVKLLSDGAGPGGIQLGTEPQKIILVPDATFKILGVSSGSSCHRKSAFPSPILVQLLSGSPSSSAVRQCHGCVECKKLCYSSRGDHDLVLGRIAEFLNQQLHFGK